MGRRHSLFISTNPQNNVPIGIPGQSIFIGSPGPSIYGRGPGAIDQGGFDFVMDGNLQIVMDNLEIYQD